MCYIFLNNALSFSFRYFDHKKLIDANNIFVNIVVHLQHPIWLLHFSDVVPAFYIVRQLHITIRYQWDCQYHEEVVTDVPNYKDNNTYKGK